MTSEEIKRLEELEKTGEIKGISSEALDQLISIREMEKAGIIVINEIFD